MIVRPGEGGKRQIGTWWQRAELLDGLAVIIPSRQFAMLRGSVLLGGLLWREQLPTRYIQGNMM